MAQIISVGVVAALSSVFFGALSRYLDHPIRCPDHPNCRSRGPCRVRNIRPARLRPAQLTSNILITLARWRGFEPLTPRFVVCCSTRRLGVMGCYQILMGGKVNSRWLQAQDLDLFSGFSLILEACSV